jgi:hypothetical protein
MNTLSRFTPLFLLALFCSISGQPSAHASDYAREKRFAEDVLAQLVVGEAVQISHVSGPAFPSFLGLFAPTADKAKPAVVFAHSVGMNPDEGLTGALRRRLHDMGYTTLAIQMPIAAKEAQIDDYYPKLFPEASARLETAAQWLTQRGYTRPVLVSHTMGSWMANVYFDAQHSTNAYKAWVCMSLTGGYSSAAQNYPFAILDVYAENDIPMTVSSAGRRASLMRIAHAGSTQVKIDGADRDWRGKDAEVAQHIDAFVKKMLP